MREISNFWLISDKSHKVLGVVSAMDGRNVRQAIMSTRRISPKLIRNGFFQRRLAWSEVEMYVPHQADRALMDYEMEQNEW